MKRNTTPQWLDFLSAPNYVPFTLDSHEFHLLGALKQTLCICCIQPEEKLWLNVFHMTEDKSTLCKNSNVTPEFNICTKCSKCHICCQKGSCLSPERNRRNMKKRLRWTHPHPPLGENIPLHSFQVQVTQQ